MEAVSNSKVQEEMQAIANVIFNFINRSIMSLIATFAVKLMLCMITKLTFSGLILI